MKKGWGRHVISQAASYPWKSKYGRLEALDPKTSVDARTRSVGVQTDGGGVVPQEPCLTGSDRKNCSAFRESGSGGLSNTDALNKVINMVSPS